MKTKEKNKHEIWAIAFVIIIVVICTTLIFLQSNAWVIRFEMDNNTLEAFKSINWSAFNNLQK